MKTLFENRGRLNGFSLVEMAVVIMIAGAMLSAGLALLTVKMAAAQLEVTQKHQEAIKLALINYLGKNQRLPCPAAINGSGTENRIASATYPPCVSYSGIVPYQTLGIERAVVLDGWENYITYVISPNPTAAVPARNAWLYTYGSAALYESTNPSLVFWPSNTSGAINVTGTNTIPNVVVTLISYGSNGYGAVNIKGGPNDSTDAGADELMNISPVTAGTPPTVNLVKRDTTDSATAVGGPFDDILMILSANDLTGPLIASGTLQSSTQATLSQANDIVMGEIVTSRTCVGSPACSSPLEYTYTIPSSVTFPASLTARGITYTNTATSISATLPPSVDIAYTLTTGEGIPKTVLIGELRGLLTRGAGFN